VNASSYRSRTAGRNALLAMSAMTVVTSTHHIYRLGWGVLIAATVILVLPVLLLLWQRRSRTRVALGAYAGFNFVMFAWFGFVDGFLDHVVKALGLANVTFLPGGDEEVVPTKFHLWSEQASHLFYEGTGIATFVIGLVMLWLTFQFVRSALADARDRDDR
jgi:hypothetical protein